MAYPFFVRRMQNALVPTSKAGQFAIEKLKFGVLYKIEPKNPRNKKLHGLFWAFAGYVSKALNDGPTGSEWNSESVKEELLCATGRSRERRMTKRERVRHGVSNEELIASAERIDQLANLILENGPTKIENIAHAMRAEAKKIKSIEAVGIIARPASISFSAMDNDEFSAFMEESMAYVRDHLAPWIQGSEHWPDIEKILVASFMLRGDDQGEDQQ